jgi:hypothetical protein
MSYEQTRDNEQLSKLDDAIGSFITRYNSNLSSTNRKTIFLFPGGMGSQLLRATTPEPDDPPYFYNTTWLEGKFSNFASEVMTRAGLPITHSEISSCWDETNGKLGEVKALMAADAREWLKRESGRLLNPRRFGPPHPIWSTLRASESQPVEPVTQTHTRS